MIAVAAVAILSAGFIFGWTVANDSGERAAGEWSEEVAATDPPPPARSLSVPDDDVEGSDIVGLPRYPGSVRIEYIREDQGELIWTETEYLTDATLEQAREFYRDTFRSSNWSVNDIGFTQNSWVFFVVDDEREVFVNLRPRGDIVEIDIEHTEPDRAEPTEPATAGEGQQVPADASGDENAGENAPAPEQVAPPQRPAYEVPPATPYYGDEGYDEDYDDYEEYDD